MQSIVAAAAGQHPAAHPRAGLGQDHARELARREPAVRGSPSSPRRSAPFSKTGGLADVSRVTAGGARRLRLRRDGRSRPLYRSAADGARARSALDDRGASTGRRSGSATSRHPLRFRLARTTAAGWCSSPTTASTTARHSTSAPTAPTIPTTSRASPFSAAPRSSTGAVRERGARRRPLNDWQTGLLPCLPAHALPAPLLGARAASSPSTTSPTRALSPPPTCYATGLGWSVFHPGGARVLRRAQPDEGRPRLRRRDHHRVADATPRRSRRRPPAAASTASCAPSATSCAASSTASTPRAGTRPPTRSCRRRFDAADLAGKAACKRALQERSGLPLDAAGDAARRDQPLRRQKGIPLICDALRIARAAAAAARGARLRRCRHRARACARWRRQYPRQVAVTDRLRRGARPSDRSRRRRLPDAERLRALRPQPDVQPALRHGADRARHRRPQGHGRRLHAGAPRRRHRLGLLLHRPSTPPIWPRPSCAPGASTAASRRAGAALQRRMHAHRPLLGAQRAGSTCALYDGCSHDRRAA